MNRFTQMLSKLRKGTISIMVLLVVLFAISIQISLELFNQKSLTFKERIRTSVLDSMSIKFRNFEDKYIASFNDTSDFATLGYLVYEIEWLDSLEIFTVSDERNNLTPVWKKSATTEQNDTFLKLTLPALKTASINLKNRFIYGASFKSQNGEFILPFAVTLTNAFGKIHTSFGKINLSLFFKEQIHFEDSKLIISPNEINQTVFESDNSAKILDSFKGELEQPNISFDIYRTRTKNQTSLSIFPRWVFSSDTILILSANFLLWISLIFYWLEHLRRVDTEKQIEEIAERAQKQANLASIGEIATAISHEVNQPISTIEIYAKMSQDMISKKGFSKDELAKNLEEIRRQTIRCGTIMKSMLSTRKLNVSQINYVFLQDLKKNVEAVIELKAKKNDTKVLWQIDPDQRVFANLVAIEQIITNFAYNGIEAMADFETENRELIISSKLENSDTNQEILKLIVSDRGPGINIPEMANIFEPFFTTKEYGNGLGLSLCKSLCEQCSATMSIQRNASKGMDFTVSIPTRKTITKNTELKIFDANRFVSLKDVV